MQRLVEYSAFSKIDLQDCIFWLTQPGAGVVAFRRLVDLKRGLDRLADFPCQGRREEGRRVLTIGRYRVIYRLHPDTGSNDTAGDVEILRILGPGQTN